MPPSDSFPPATASLVAELARERAARVLAETEAAGLRLQLERVSATASRARRLAEHLPMGLLLIDPTGRIQLATQRLYQLLELREPAPAVVGSRYSVLLRQVARLFAQPAEVRAWSRIIPRGGVPVRNLQLARSDGRVLEIDAQPLAETEGGGWLLVTRDVTAREAARREVAEQRAFYEAILDNLPSDVAVLDPEHRYRFVNPAAVVNPAMRQWLIGRTDAEYCSYRRRPAEVAERRYALFDEAVRTRSLMTWEEEMPAPDGTLRTLRRNLQPVFDGPTGELRMMIGYGFDLTALRAAQRTVDEQRTFYETVLDNLPADVAVFDDTLRYRYLNPQAQPDPEIRQWVVGHTWAEYVAHAQVPPERAEQRWQVFRQVLTTREVVSWDESILFPGATTPRILRRHLRPLFHANGAPYLLIGYGVDITVVREAQRAAEEAARARENFLANMSHEIRTPLNGVLGMVALLAKTSLSVTQHEYLEIVGTSGRHLLSLLNDVLDMAKINSGHLELETAPFRLADTLRGAAQNVAFRAAEQEVELLTESAGIVALEGVVGDAYRLQQVLLNLLTNALKFAPGGQVTLAARVLATTDTTVRVRFSVCDDGIGIPAERQEAVFEEFTQAYTDTTRRFGGTGLGLAISQRLVSQMGGHLMVTSNAGEGTIFAFTLPFERALAEPADASPDHRRLSGGAVISTALPRLDGRRVLLVEDQDVNRLLARLLLEANGATVYEAPSGPRALAWMAANPAPDVVLMDIQMPGMSGLDVTRRIRALSDPARHSVPIVALTANAFRGDIERYLAAGMNACLTKPFEEADLVRLIDTLAGPVAPSALAVSVVAADESPVGIATKAPEGSSVYPATLLRVGRGDPAFARRIIATFCAGGPAALLTLQEALHARNALAAAEVAHRLVPSVRLFDEAELADTLVEIERSSAADPNWPDALAFAEQELAALIVRLESLLAADDVI